MHRVTRATLGTVAIGLVAVFLVAGMVGGGLLGAYHASSGQTAKASPVGSVGTGMAPFVPAAQTYQTTIDLVFNTTLGAATPVPAAWSFYANITFGSIDNTNTHAWVVVYDDTTSTVFATYTLNTTITVANVAKSINNGVPFENYTWFTSLDKTTLGCAVVSCADMIPATDDSFTITAYVTENGASMGGGLASASASADTMLVSTYASVGFITPNAFPYSLSPVPAAVEFYTNISWGYTSNATTNVTLEVYNFFTVSPFAELYFSFNGTVNATNSLGFSSVAGFNGTVAGVQYSYTTWMLTLNNTTLVCGAVVSCNTTLPIQTDGYQGLPTYFFALVNENGSLAGGLAVATGPIASEPNAVILGSTLINAGVNGGPIPYQPLPYVATGWVNVSWVNPTIAAGVGNASVAGYVLIWDESTTSYIGSFTLNNSVNTTLADGVSLMVAANGTANGVPFQNYTWTWDLTATATSLGANVPYDPLDLIANVSANGNMYGGTDQYTGPTYVVSTTFVQYPTAIAASFTSPFKAYMSYPFQVNYTIAVTNALISPTATTIVVNVTSAAVGLLTSNSVTVIPGQTNYTFEINAASLACSDPGCSGLPQTEYTISVFAGEVGVGLPTNGSVASSQVAQGFFLIVTPLSAALVSPAAGTSSSVGNVTVSVAYLGSWVAGAVLNIYSSTNALVYSHGFVELTPGVPVNGTWFIGQSGTYTYAIVMTTVYLPTTHYFNGTITVISKGGTVYQNTSKYSNESAISGLSGAAAGTILLVVGLIVGMIVALVLARAVMGRPAAAPPQPWESKPGTPGGAPNTCSVCSKSFSTPEELAAHGKSEHGMQ
ncbi:MAG: hypothetical protein ACLPP2_07345 [Thermoplasmata archaeon]